jgi:hypothetical protein
VSLYYLISTLARPILLTTKTILLFPTRHYGSLNVNLFNERVNQNLLLLPSLPQLDYDRKIDAEFGRPVSEAPVVADRSGKLKAMKL